MFYCVFQKPKNQNGASEMIFLNSYISIKNIFLNNLPYKEMAQLTNKQTRHLYRMWHSRESYRVSRWPPTTQYFPVDC